MPADPMQRKRGVPPGDHEGRPASANEPRPKDPPPPKDTPYPRSAVLVDPDSRWLDLIEDTFRHLGVEVTGTAREPGEALALIRQHRPELLVVDVRTRGEEMDGLECLQRAREESPALKALVLSDDDEREHIEAAFEAGASAYIAKPRDPADIATAIRQIFERSVFPAAGALSAERRSRMVANHESAGLTQRELEVLRHVAEGRSNAEIAGILWVTEQTIKFHLANVYKKLGVKNRTQAWRRAETLGLLSDPPEAGGRSTAIA